MTHAPARPAVALLTLLLAAPLAGAQIKEPPRAEKLDLQVRYRIRADRDERVRQYRALEKHLASLGFDDARKNDPDRDLDVLDPSHERFTGTIPGAKVMDVLADPRVQTILFAPSGFTYPDSGDKPVAVRLGLRTGLLPAAQQLLHGQAVAHLGRLGFVESLGYDTRGYSIIRGAIPYQHLDKLVKDLRTEPGGWFLTDTPPDQLPAPLRDRNPVLWAEVLPVTDFPPPFSPPPVLPVQFKYSADLRAALLDPGAKDKPMRVEVLFQNRVTDVRRVRDMIQGRFAGATLDGVIGNVATVRFPRPADVARVALEPGVVGVRLPRAGNETVAPGAGAKGVTPADAIRAARLGELHLLGYTGAGVKVVLVGSDFTGADRLIGTELPKRTRIVDLTAELSPEILPAKPDPTRAGTGTAAARALAAAAPGAELVLVRIDPECFFHLDTVIQLARGEVEYTDALQLRLTELAGRATALEREKRAAIEAYRAAFADLSDSEVAVKNRAKAKAALDDVLKREKELGAVLARFNAYQKELTAALAGAGVIVNTLVWESGYPLDALSEFAGTLERLAAVPPPTIQRRPADPAAAPKPPLVWVQAASDARAGVWGGPFLDANGDGLMEFVPPQAKLPPENWSPQMNFLGTRAAGGGVTPDLAAGAKLRFVVQWREPADPNFPEGDIPAYPLVLRLFRQIDPEGKTRSSDEMTEVARSVSVPQVIFRTRTFLVFEQMLEVAVPAAGRYALAIETRGAEEPLLPALRRELEIYPRVVVETVGVAPGDPKAVFRSFSTPSAGVGTPGDALGAITIGTDAPGALVGGGTGLTLREKPNYLGPDVLTFGAESYRGPGVATAFAGGVAAVLLQARAAGPNVFESAKMEAGKKLEIPEGWLKAVRQIEKGKP